MSMKSPRDPSASLAPLRYGAIELDRCPTTGGVWFDADELYELTRVMAEGDDVAASFGGDWPTYGDAAAPGGCPRGHGPLEGFPVPRAEGGTAITLDVCRSCMGIWVDGAELLQLREVVLHNRAHGGPPVIEPIPRAGSRAALHALGWLNPFEAYRRLRT